ncbi:MAG: hypothetical protein EP332_05080 [Bacteroidetes bacterium]|nr:MAG: hypothetical protein EP332_05080 [Bacteroidota bacterium]
MNQFYTFLLIPPFISFAGASLLDWLFKSRFTGISRRRYNFIIISLASVIYLFSLITLLIQFPIHT